MKSTAITIKDLSFLSGYSVSTVSKALNNKKDISESTRKTIKGLAKERNYIPNNFAVGLRVKVPNAVAVILPTVTENCYSNALHYIQKIAEENGFRVLLFQSFNDIENEKRYIETLKDGAAKAIFRFEKNISEVKSETLLPMISVVINNNSEKAKIKEKCIEAFTSLQVA